MRCQVKARRGLQGQALALILLGLLCKREHGPLDKSVELSDRRENSTRVLSERLPPSDQLSCVCRLGAPIHAQDLLIVERVLLREP